ncbi:MAG: hypothetical protein IT289_09015 [Oligoflexia bacterium]|nr:hypothetical protein [Oligoflexia bacterium]
MNKNRALKTISLFVIFSLFGGLKAQAYVVHELEPGILELKGIQSSQTLVVEKVFIDKKRRWVYLGVREEGFRERLPNQILPEDFSTSARIRYFYAPYNEVKIARGNRLKSIQFGIERRISNKRGKIPFGSQKYFYPLINIERLS